MNTSPRIETEGATRHIIPNTGEWRNPPPIPSKKLTDPVKEVMIGYMINSALRDVHPVRWNGVQLVRILANNPQTRELTHAIYESYGVVLPTADRALYLPQDPFASIALNPEANVTADFVSRKHRVVTLATGLMIPVWHAENPRIRMKDEARLRRFKAAFDGWFPSLPLGKVVPRDGRRRPHTEVPNAEGMKTELLEALLRMENLRSMRFMETVMKKPELTQDEEVERVVAVWQRELNQLRRGGSRYPQSP